MVLLVADVELEGVCAFAIVINTDNESRLSTISENTNVNIALLPLPVISAFFIAYLLYAFSGQ